MQRAAQVKQIKCGFWTARCEKKFIASSHHLSVLLVKLNHLGYTVTGEIKPTGKTRVK